MTDTRFTAAMRHVEALEAIHSDPTASRGDRLFEFNMHVQSTSADDLIALDAAVTAFCLKHPGSVPAIVEGRIRRMVQDVEKACARRMKAGVTAWTGEYAIALFKDAIATMRTLAIRGGRNPVGNLTRDDLEQLEKVPTRLLRAALALMEDAAPAIQNAATDKKTAAAVVQMEADFLAAALIPALAVPMALITGEYQHDDSRRINWDGTAEVKQWGYEVASRDGGYGLAELAILVDHFFGRIVGVSERYAPDSNPRANEFLHETRAVRKDLTVVSQ